MVTRKLIEGISIINKCGGSVKFDVLKDINKNKHHFTYFTQEEADEYLNTFKTN